jgi:hypothetical protein
MTRELFFNLIRYYERRLFSLGIRVPGFPGTITGLNFVYRNHAGVCLMLGGKELGEACWRDDGIVFDPPLRGGRSPKSITQLDLDEWAALAYSRSLTSDWGSAKLAPRSPIDRPQARAAGH